MKRQINNILWSCIIITSIVFGSKAFAVVKLPAIISDNMVLQGDLKSPVWGWASSGEAVQVDFRGKKYKAVASAEGKWSVKIDTGKAGGPYEMTVSGKENTVKIKNILVGEVWVASGQSNMEFGIQTDSRSAEAIAQAKDANIRMFFVTWATSLQPKDDIASAPQGSLNGKWVVCTPEAMANPQWAWHGFSAVGYYFAQQIRKSTGKPVGMIATYKGGTPAQAWMSQDALKQPPAFSKYVDRHQQLVSNYEQGQAAYLQRQLAFESALKVWNEEIGKDLNKKTAEWQIAAAQAKANGSAVPQAPRPARPKPQAPAQPDGGYSAPSNLFNGMIAPIVPYGIKGVIWYQAESNADRLADAIEYNDLFPRLIIDWRERWGQGAFPFLYVQLPNFRNPAVTASEGIWPWVREAQMKTLAIPKTGMAVTIDLGDPKDIHPTAKYYVGLRMALAARHVAYGEKLVYSGPAYKNMEIKGNEIHLTFTEIGSGLKSSSSTAQGDTELKGFGVAGADKKFVWAKAVLSNNTVIVSTEGISNPVAVRYNWADNPSGNLYNKEGLPAAPFRTDNWSATDSGK